MKHLPSHQQKRHWLRNAFAGMMFLLGCTLMLAGCGPFGNVPVATPVPVATQPTPTPGPAQAVALKQIHMLDSKNGWAISSNDHVLRTSTGANHWLDVTPQANSVGTSQLGAVDFLDPLHAWVALQSGSDSSVMYTLDGGNLWLQAPVIDQAQGRNPIGQITFSDAEHGWLLFTRSGSASQLAVDVFASTDGGTTWLDALNATKQARPAGQTSDLVLGKNTPPAITFADGLHGWVTGAVPADQPLALLMTQDGGATWTNQTLPRPAGSNAVASATYAPMFFGAQDGVLPVLFTSGANATNGSALSVYVTHDGGTSWSTAAPTPGLTANTSFVDTQHGWTITSGNGIAATSDGGQHWATLTEKLAPDVSTLAALNFVSASTGWVVATLATHTTVLLQTTDGGHSWTQVDTMAAAQS